MVACGGRLESISRPYWQAQWIAHIPFQYWVSRSDLPDQYRTIGTLEIPRLSLRQTVDHPIPIKAGAINIPR